MGEQAAKTETYLLRTDCALAPEPIQFAGHLDLQRKFEVLGSSTFLYI